MNEDYSGQAKRTRKYWIMGVSAGVVFILLIGSFFIYQGMKKRQYVKHIETAENYVAVKEYDKAIVAYRLAIKINKKQVRPYQGLSDAYIAQGEYSQARLVLKAGMLETGSALLEQMYAKIRDIPDESGLQADVQSMYGNGSNGEWNDSLITEIGHFSYKNYVDEYGQASIRIGESNCSVAYPKLGAILYFDNSEETKINTLTGKPYDGTVPSYIVFDDLSKIFYNCGEGLSLETIEQIIGSAPEIRNMGNSQWILNFQYRGCDFSIDCDENGFIQNQMASNKVIPLSKSVEQPQGTVQGSMVDATTGGMLEDVTINFRQGDNVKEGDPVATTTSNTSGDITLDLPEDTYTMEFSKEGYTIEYMTVTITQGNTEDIGVKALSPTLGEGEWRIVLEWGEEPADLDAHLETSSWHVWFSNPQATGSDGTEVNLDVDEREGKGPETITVSQMNPDEKYEFYVYNYSSNGAKNSDALGKSEAVVKLYLSNGEMMQYSVPSGTGTVWNVFNIVNGEVKEINELAEIEN